MARPATLALLIAFTFAAARADFKIQFQLTEGTHTGTQTGYYKPQFWRADLSGRTYIIVDSANRQSIIVDAAARQYSVTNTERAPQPPADPDQTIVAEIQTKETGEQRQIFGHTAHHILTTLRRHTEYRNQPPSEIQETVTDGWYLDLPDRFPMLSRAGTVAYLAFSTDRRNVSPRIAVKTIGRAPEGLPVWEKSGDRVLEVTELSEAPLDPKVFEPPSDFRRVVRPPWGEPLSLSDLLRLRWQQFLDWLGLA